jgi:hypothetical protein
MLRPYARERAPHIARSGYFAADQQTRTVRDRPQRRRSGQRGELTQLGQPTLRHDETR